MVGEVGERVMEIRIAFQKTVMQSVTVLFVLFVVKIDFTKFTLDITIT